MASFAGSSAAAAAAVVSAALSDITATTEHPLTAGERIPRSMVLSSRSGGLRHYVEYGWQLVSLHELPSSLRTSMTELELGLCWRGFGPYRQGAVWTRFLMLGIVPATSMRTPDVNPDEVHAESDRYVWRLLNEKKDPLGKRYIEMHSPVREHPFQPWELPESEWELHISRTVAIGGERWQARHRGGMFVSAKVWVQCHGPFEDEHAVDQRLEEARLVMQRLDHSPETLYLFGATPDDAHRELVDKGPWTLETHAENGMPAYRQSDRVRMRFIGGAYFVLNDKGRPVLRVSLDEDELMPPVNGGARTWQCTGHLTRDGEVHDWVDVPELRCGAGGVGRVEHEQHVTQRAALDRKDRNARDLRPPGSVKCEKKKLRKGDHIYVPTEQGAVYHHALVLDEPEPRTRMFRLVHYLTEGVQVTSSGDDTRFLARDWVWLLPRANYYGGKFGPVLRTADEIVKAAVSVFQSGQEADRKGRPCAHRFAAKDYCAYWLLGAGNNCEHFCSYAVLGKRICHQAAETNKDVASTGGGALTVGGAVAGGALIATGPIGWTIAGVSAVVGVGVFGWHAWRLPQRAMDASAASRLEDDQHATAGASGPSPPRRPKTATPQC